MNIDFELNRSMYALENLENILCLMNNIFILAERSQKFKYLSLHKTLR